MIKQVMAAILAVPLVASAHTVTLTFVPPANADQVVLYRGTQAGGPYSTIATLSGTATSYSDQNVADGGFYSYVATARNSIGESGYSAEATVSIPSSVPQTTATPEMITVSPASLAFAGQSGLADPSGQALSIADTTPAGVHVPFQLATDQTWLWATTDNFSTSSTVIVTSRMAGLAPGSYSGNVLISAPDYTVNGVTYTFTNSPLRIPVALTISPAATPPPASEPRTLTSLAWVALAPLKVGTQVQLHATANYSDGSSQDVTPLVAWTSSNNKRLSVSPTGLATISSAGLVTVTASLSAKQQVTTVK